MPFQQVVFVLTAALDPSLKPLQRSSLLLDLAAKWAVSQLSLPQRSLEVTRIATADIPAAISQSSTHRRLKWICSRLRQALETPERNAEEGSSSASTEKKCLVAVCDVPLADSASRAALLALLRRDWCPEIALSTALLVCSSSDPQTYNTSSSSSGLDLATRTQIMQGLRCSEIIQQQQKQQQQDQPITASMSPSMTTKLEGHRIVSTEIAVETAKEQASSGPPQGIATARFEPYSATTEAFDVVWRDDLIHPFHSGGLQRCFTNCLQEQAGSCKIPPVDALVLALDEVLTMVAVPSGGQQPVFRIDALERMLHWKHGNHRPASSSSVAQPVVFLVVRGALENGQSLSTAHIASLILRNPQLERLGVPIVALFTCVATTTASGSHSGGDNSTWYHRIKESVPMVCNVGLGVLACRLFGVQNTTSGDWGSSSLSPPSFPPIIVDALLRSLQATRGATAAGDNNGSSNETIGTSFQICAPYRDDGKLILFLATVNYTPPWCHAPARDDFASSPAAASEEADEVEEEGEVDYPMTYALLTQLTERSVLTVAESYAASGMISPDSLQLCAEGDTFAYVSCVCLSSDRSQQYQPRALVRWKKQGRARGAAPASSRVPIAHCPCGAWSPVHHICRHIAAMLLIIASRKMPLQLEKPGTKESLPGENALNISTTAAASAGSTTTTTTTAATLPATSKYTPMPVGPITDSGLPLYMQLQQVQHPGSSGIRRRGANLNLEGDPFSSSSGKSKRLRSEVEGPNAPKGKRLTPFFYFCRTARTTLREEHPELKMGELARLLGERWKALSEDERARFTSECREEGEEWDRQWEAYRNTEEYRSLNEPGRLRDDADHMPQERLAHAARERQEEPHRLVTSVEQPSAPIGSLDRFEQVNPEWRTDERGKWVCNWEANNEAEEEDALASPAKSRSSASLVRRARRVPKLGSVPVGGGGPFYEDEGEDEEEFTNPTGEAKGLRRAPNNKTVETYDETMFASYGSALSSRTKSRM